MTLFSLAYQEDPCSSSATGDIICFYFLVLINWDRSPALYIPFNFPKGRHITCHWYHCTLINFIIENHNSLFVRLGNRYPLCSSWFVIHEYSWVADFFHFQLFDIGVTVWHVMLIDHTTCSLSNFLDTVWYILISINWLCFTFFTR